MSDPTARRGDGMWKCAYDGFWNYEWRKKCWNCGRIREACEVKEKKSNSNVTDIYAKHKC